MTDNGSVCRSRRWVAAYRGLDLRHLRTKPYTSRTNGEAERLIGTMLRSWARAFAYRSSSHRSKALASWLRWYNRPHPHASLAGLPPASRVPHLRDQQT